VLLKNIPKTCGEVLRSRKVSLGLSGEPEEKHDSISKDWGLNGVEMRLRRGGQKGREWR